ncbi:MAG TPA: tetratricopeptide repeat protein [Allocoleopsis sp.]
MSLTRGRWLVNIILVMMLIAFLGLFTFPLIESVLKENQTSATVSSGYTVTQLEKQSEGYEQVLLREPDNRTALKGLLDIRLQLGDLKRSVELLEKLANMSPEQTDYMILLAQAKQQLGEIDAAANAYRSVLSSQPGNLNALQGISSLFLQQNRPEAAIGLLQDTLKTVNELNSSQPGSIDSISIQLLLGQVYVNEKRYTEALTMYDEAGKSNPNDFRPLLAKAIVFQQVGKLSESKPLFNMAMTLAPAEYKDQIKQLSNSTPNPIPTPSTPYLQKQPVKK